MRFLLKAAVLAVVGAAFTTGPVLGQEVDPSPSAPVTEQGTGDPSGTDRPGRVLPPETLLPQSESGPAMRDSGCGHGRARGIGV